MHFISRCLMPLVLFAATTVPAVTGAAPATPARAAAAAPAAPPVPLLWKVTGKGDARVYLLGSFHLLRPGDYPLAAETNRAFEASKRLVFELSAEDMNSPDLAGRMVKAAMRPAGGSLRDEVDAATWSRLQAWSADNGLPLAQLQGMKAWFVGLTISIAQMQKLGLDPQLGLDRHFMQRASAAGKPISGLEDIDTQIGLLAGMSATEQQQMLAEALDQADKGDSEVRALHDAWRRGDDRMLWNTMAAEMKTAYPQLYGRINTERNDAWMPQLESRLQAGQGGTMVVVGALHLLGADGVVEKLRAKGYKVERLGAAR